MAESIKSDLLQTANIIASGIASVQTLEEQKVKSIMSILDIAEEERVIITNDAGFVIFDNSQYDSVKGRYMLMAELVKALGGDDSFHSIFKEGAFETVVAVPVVLSGEIAGAVYIYEYDLEQGALLLSMKAYMRNISLLLVAVFFVIFVFFATGMSRRLKTLREAVNELREGDYSQRIAIRGSDEIAQIADEFNSLSERLEFTEERRRLFVSNASHELKTPLASIKLLTDSILQTEGMSREDVDDFLEDISGEIVRLTRITDKLLSLTKLDINIHDAFTAVDVSRIVQRASHMLQPLAEHYKISISCDVSDGCIVRADEDGIYQIVFNLMENAAKYNRPDGYVHAMTFVKEGLVWCIVDDTGIGVPAGELEHIFERFYRIDKARSRETGGTGLGLSIVRRTVEMYDGRVWAENREPEGSRFVFTIPQCTEDDVPDAGGEA